jgi:hypothetical protein
VRARVCARYAGREAYRSTGNVADVVAFPASDGARWINGTTIDVDGFQDSEATDAAVPNPSKLRDTFMPSLYQSNASPNSRRVRMYLAEKGIPIPVVPVDLGKKEQFSDAYAAINPRRVIPTLGRLGRSLRALYRLPHAARCCGHIDAVDAEWTQRINDRIDDDRRSTDGAGFADTFHADRIGLAANFF